MEKYFTHIREFHENNQKEIDFVKNHLAKHLENNTENQDEIEHILDYLYSNKTVKIENIGYSTIKEKANKWIKKLNSVSTKDTEIEGVDYEVYLDFKDGFKIVKLLSKSCYEREGKLMSHCVGGYYGRNTTIYSLRDSNNKPHCTIEDGNQLKGKGNGNIDPKYVDYIVKFLEKTGMTVGENEMKNLGYYKLENIDKDLKSDSLYNGYIYEGKIDTIKDKDGDTYMGFGLLNIKKLLEIKIDFSLNWNFDLNLMLSYLFKKIDKITAVANKSYSTAVANKHSSTAVANESSSTAVANEHSSTAVARGSSSTAVANEHSSTAVARGSYSTAVANKSYSTAVARGSYSTAVANEHSSTAVANEHSSTAVANEHSSTAVARGSYSTAVANKSSSTAVANGKNSIALIRSYKSKAKGTNGAWIILTEWDKSEENILDIKAKQVDGNIIKENTLYILKNGEFTEVSE